MSTMAQLENEIQSLPASDFFHLMEWMEERHLRRLSVDGFEAPELEAAVLRGLEGQAREWNGEMRDRIRAGLGEAANG